MRGKPVQSEADDTIEERPYQLTKRSENGANGKYPANSRNSLFSEFDAGLDYSADLAEELLKECLKFWSDGARLRRKRFKERVDLVFTHRVERLSRCRVGGTLEQRLHLPPQGIQPLTNELLGCHFAASSGKFFRLRRRLKCQAGEGVIELLVAQFQQSFAECRCFKVYGRFALILGQERRLDLRRPTWLAKARCIGWVLALLP